MTNRANIEIRQALLERGIKHYEIAAACNVSVFTFSRWLRSELPLEKKKYILECIKGIEFEEPETKAKWKAVLDDGAFEPKRAHSADAGLDIKSPVDATIPSGGSVVIDTGFHISIPHGYYGELRGRSGLHIKHDIVCFGGTIDSGFENSISVKLYNLGKSNYQIHAGDRIVQLVIMPCELPTLEFVSSFDGNSERGQNGIGSTGR